MHTRETKLASLTSQARRAQIVDGAVKVIAREGLARASFARVAAAAGLSSPGMISYHFADKDELFTVLCDSLLRDGAETIEAAVTSAVDARAALAAYFTSFIAWQDAHRDGVAALWRLSSGWKPPGRKEAFDETPLVEPLRRLLAEGAASGELRAVNTEWVTLTVLSAVESFHEALKTDPGIDASEFAAELVALFGQGLEVRR